MSGVVIANEVKLYYEIAVSLRICNDCFIGPFAIVSPDEDISGQWT
jgi:hypothetical protein